MCLSAQFSSVHLNSSKCSLCELQILGRKRAEKQPTLPALLFCPRATPPKASALKCSDMPTSFHLAAPPVGPVPASNSVPRYSFPSSSSPNGLRPQMGLFLRFYSYLTYQTNSLLLQFYYSLTCNPSPVVGLISQFRLPMAPLHPVT